MSQFQDDYSSGEKTNFQDLELDPTPTQLTEVSTNTEAVPVSVNIFEESEPASMLTADRLLKDEARPRVVPETFWRRFIYRVTFGKLNLGDNRKVRERRSLDARINADLRGETKFVPVLTRKGGVGKTTVTTLIGMAMALVREDRVLAIDANPDRGTLAERVELKSDKTVRDVVRRLEESTASQFSATLFHATRPGLMFWHRTLTRCSLRRLMRATTTSLLT